MVLLWVFSKKKTILMMFNPYMFYMCGGFLHFHVYGLYLSRRGFYLICVYRNREPFIASIMMDGVRSMELKFFLKSNYLRSFDRIKSFDIMILADVTRDC